jgi:hypothetical protein
MTVNEPAVLAEVRAAFERYECALVTNDLETLDELFWHSVLVIRYGIADIEYGIKAVRAFRVANTFNHSGRTLEPTVITTFGDDFATANTEFRTADTKLVGRQSQTWARMANGWCIVSAHVSLIPADNLQRS